MVGGKAVKKVKRMKEVCKRSVCVRYGSTMTLFPAPLFSHPFCNLFAIFSIFLAKMIHIFQWPGFVSQ